MRLVMLNNEFPPLGGGTGTVNRALLGCFAEVPGLAIDLITSGLGARPEEIRFADEIRIHKVPVRNQNIHHSSNRELLTYAARAWRVAVRLHRARPYDLGFAWSTLPAGAVAWALHRWTGLSYVVRVSGPDIPGFEQRYGRLYPILTPVIRAIWLRARIVVVKCREETDMIRAVEPRASIATVPNGVDLAVFRPGQPGTRSGPMRLLCVGRQVERKGQHHLLEAVGRLRAAGIGVTLDLVGTGDTEATNRALAEALGLSDSVRFHGYVPREAIGAHYASADVFVLPSANEGMSVATLEAMAAGLPVVVTRTGGTAELVEEGVNGLTFACGDVEALTGHLHRLAQDRALVRRAGAASRARAAGFSWQDAARRYLAMFEALAGPVRAAAREPDPRAGSPGG